MEMNNKRRKSLNNRKNNLKQILIYNSILKGHNVLLMTFFTIKILKI